MDIPETIKLIGVLESYSAFTRRKGPQGTLDQAMVWAPVLEDVPAEFATQYVIRQVSTGHTVREVSEITAAWIAHRNERLRDSDAQLIAPQAVADDPRSWQIWTRTARSALGRGASVSQAEDEANTAVGHTPALEASQPVSAEESRRRLRELAAQMRKPSPDPEAGGDA